MWEHVKCNMLAINAQPVTLYSPQNDYKSLLLVA